MRLKKLNKFLFFAILLLAFFLRLYKIDNPIADWHSWRQADTSSVTRYYVLHGIDLLHPKYDDLSNIPSGKDNPQGYRFVEFPLYNGITAIASKAFPFLTVEVWGRLISIFASLGTLVFLYLLARKYLGERGSLLTAFFFAVLPYNIYYSRAILPDIHLVFATTGAIYFFDKWIEKNKFLNWLFAVVFFATGLLFKTYAVFITPVFIYLAVRRYKFRSLINLHFISFIILSFFPIMIWRLWMQKFPEGIPAYTWLFNEGNIRFRPAFFRWILYERLTKLILGFGGLPVLLAGFFSKPKEEGWLFYVWALSIGLYISVIAAGNVRHDYYQIFAIPIICIFLGKGMDYLLNLLSRPEPNLFWFRVTFYLLLFTSMEYFSWNIVKTYYWINNPAIIEAGIAVDKITPPEAKVIAPYGGDTAFLYQTNRQGWPQGFDIEDKIKKGASYYVNINLPDPETKYVENKYQVIKKTDKYVIVKLK